MLKPRLPQSPAPPQSRVRIGTHIVDLSAREVTDEVTGERIRITGKAQGVVAELAVSAGQVLSRDELMDRVWPGAFPTGDVLTQAITSLRKAFGDDAEAPRYIETISKSGYRLIAPVQWLAAENRPLRVATLNETGPVDATASVPSASVPSQTRYGKWGWWLLAAAAALGVLIAYWRSQSTQATEEAHSVKKRSAALVVVAGVGDDWGPRLSPDGSVIVFASSPVQGASSQLFLQSAMIATPTPLTHPSEGERDMVPTWSPDGRQIAFQRHSEQAACRIMLIAASGGTPRQVGLCPANMVLINDWTPDGKFLLFGGIYDAKREGFPIHRMALASGEWSALDYPTEPGNLDLEPRYSPDGRWIAFRRNLSSSDLWRIPVGGGKPERLTRIASDIRGYDWSPDGRHIVFSSIGENGMALFSLEIATGAIAPLGVEDATFPDFARSGSTLVYEIYRGQLALTSIDLSTASAPAQRILESSGSQLNGEASPDGTAIAFYSDRSSRPAVWVAPLVEGGGAAQPVEGFVPLMRFNPAWDSDNRRFLVVGFGDKGGGLYEVDRDSLRAVFLETPFGAPRFADYLDGDQLIVGSLIEERQSLWVVSRRGNALRPVRPQLDGVAYAQVEPSGERIFFVRIGQRGLWSTDRSLTDTHRLFESLPNIVGYKLWTFNDEQLIIAAFDQDQNEYKLNGWPLDRIEGKPVYTRGLGELEPVTIGASSPGRLVLTESYGDGRDVGMTDFAPQAHDR